MSKRKQAHDQAKRKETYTERIQNVIKFARCHSVCVCVCVVREACVWWVVLVDEREIKRKGRGRGRGTGRRRGRGREREREQERKREEEEERGKGNRERESERKRERQRAITDYHFEMRAANHATGLHQTHGNVICFWNKFGGFVNNVANL